MESFTRSNKKATPQYLFNSNEGEGETSPKASEKNKIKMFYEELGNPLEEGYGHSDVLEIEEEEKKRRLKKIIGHLLEIFLILLICVSVILSICLLCMLKFC